MIKTLVNIVGFQLAWFACVLGAAQAMPWLGLVVAAEVLAIHLAIHRERLSAETALVASAALLGFAADSLLVLGAFVEFPGHARLGSPSTLWMAALWAGFASTLNVSLRWLHGRYEMAAAWGAVAGPLAYYAGESFGALSLGSVPVASMTTIALEWALATPVLVWWARWTQTHLGSAHLAKQEVRT